ncbi:hypothetical protein Hanom_Chr04g00363061 [Helianthus anomalus]
MMNSVLVGLWFATDFDPSRCRTRSPCHTKFSDQNSLRFSNTRIQQKVSFYVLQVIPEPIPQTACAYHIQMRSYQEHELRLQRHVHLQSKQMHILQEERCKTP